MNTRAPVFGIAQALALGLCMGFVVSTASCGGSTATTQKCNRATCPNGCCDDQTGLCVGSNDAGQQPRQTCGLNGATCAACSADKICVQGQCRLGGSGQGGGTGTGTGGNGANGGNGGGQVDPGGCNTVNCADGCCNAQGGCVKPAGQSRIRCGGNAETCASCSGLDFCLGKTDGGTGNACRKSDCTTCLDAAGNCRTTDTRSDPHYCGANGGLCAVCNTLETCKDGRCVGTSNFCNTSNCDGCCSGLTCVSRNQQTNAQCGVAANSCRTCNAPGTCDMDAGVCIGENPGGACDPTTCPSGCCMFGVGCQANGTAVFPFVEATGTGGQTCQMCIYWPIPRTKILCF